MHASAIVVCNNNFYLNLLHTKNSKCIIKQHKKERRSEKMLFCKKEKLGDGAAAPCFALKKSECVCVDVRIQLPASTNRAVSGKSIQRIGQRKRIERQGGNKNAKLCICIRSSICSILYANDVACRLGAHTTERWGFSSFFFFFM